MLSSVTSLTLGDEEDAWRAAGFLVEHGSCVLGDVTLRFEPPTATAGITGWTVFHPDEEPGHRSLDGLETDVVDDLERPRPVVHPNGTTGLDHIVIATSDLDRTTAGFADLGVEARRDRDTTAGDAPLRQRFFRMGTIIELIGPPEPDGTDTPARFWGLAVVTDDIDATARALGDALSSPKDAVQPGRRIATLRTRELGISVPVAFMTPHRGG